jgi:pimeloyl-ACP methyl ester carboxylesterase
LSFPILYRSLRDALAEISGQTVSIAPAYSYDWFPGTGPADWKKVLTKLDRAIRKAANSSPMGKVTLVGHSAGGVLARLYLSPEPLLGRAFRGVRWVEHLITIGSPHDNQSGVMFGGRMSQWVNERCPGSTFAPQVRYTSVVGRACQGNRRGSFRRRLAYFSYRGISGRGDAWGDGIVPIRAAWLDRAQQIVLEGVNHYVGFGRPWYGSPEVIPQWWQRSGVDRR